MQVAYMVPHEQDPLLAFDAENRLLHGVFAASGQAELHIEPAAFGGSLLAQAPP